jgi:predicted nucleic acid-binding protein
VELRDTLLAGIVLVRGCPIATRNVRHFDDLSEMDRRVVAIDPWRDGAAS